MKYFKSPNNEIYGYEEDGSQDHIIPKNFVSVTKEEAQIIIAVKEQERFEARPWYEKRIANYPPMTDYLDGLVKGDVKQMQDYIDACLEVKKKFPKPESV